MYIYFFQSHVTWPQEVPTYAKKYRQRTCFLDALIDLIYSKKLQGRGNYSFERLLNLPTLFVNFQGN